MHGDLAGQHRGCDSAAARGGRGMISKKTIQALEERDWGLRFWAAACGT